MVKIHIIVGINVDHIGIHLFYKIILQLLDALIIRTTALFGKLSHMGMGHIPERTAGFHKDDVIGVKISAHQFHILVHIGFPVKFLIPHHIDLFDLRLVLRIKSTVSKFRIFSKHLVFPFTESMSRCIAHVHHEKFSRILFQFHSQTFFQIHRQKRGYRLFWSHRHSFRISHQGEQRDPQTVPKYLKAIV